MDERAGDANGVDVARAATTEAPEGAARTHTRSRRSRRRSAVMRLLAGGIGLGALAQLGTPTARAANGDPVLAGQTVDATAPTRVRNGVSYTADSTADGLQGYATGANNSGLFGRNNVTDGIGVSGTAPSGTGVFGESLNGFGIGGKSDSKYGVYGVSTTGIGGVFSGGLAPLRLTPAASGTGAPISGTHAVGELYADSTGVLHYCTAAGTPGTWQQVAVGSGGGGMTNPMTTQDDLIVGGSSGTPARLAKGTNGQVLTLDGSGHVSWATPSGGGSSSDFMAPITSPPSSGWSWVNQGSATTSRISSAEVVEVPGASGSQARCRFRSLPSGSYTLTALVVPTLVAKNYLTYGLYVRESSSGKLIILGYSFANALFLAVGKYNSASSYNSNYATYTAFSTVSWLRIQDDGTDRICSISADGRSFVEVHRVGRTDFMTPDQIGFGADANNAGSPNLPIAISLVSWSGVS